MIVEQFQGITLVELVKVQRAHGKTARPLRLMGHLKRLHHNLEFLRGKNRRSYLF